MNNLHFSTIFSCCRAGLPAAAVVAIVGSGGTGRHPVQSVCQQLDDFEVFGASSIVTTTHVVVAIATAFLSSDSTAQPNWQTLWCAVLKEEALIAYQNT